MVHFMKKKKEKADNKKNVDNSIVDEYNITSRKKKERDLYPPDQRIAMGQMPSK